MLLVSLVLSTFVRPFLFFLSLFGHVVHVKSISLFPPSIHGITYAQRSAPEAKASASIGSISLALHVPLPWSPRFATITVKGYTFTESNKHALNFETATITYWFLPVFFCMTAGTILSVKLDGFTVDIVDSEGEPGWLKAMRFNITETIFQGETIRLHNLKTKVWLYQPITPSIDASRVDIAGSNMGEVTGSKRGHEDVEEEEEDEEDAPQTEDTLGNDAVKCREAMEEFTDETEARVRLHAVHWLIHNHRNHRMYAFGELNAELRRPWGAPPYPVSVDAPTIEAQIECPAGSLVIRMTDSSWTKLPRPYIDEAYIQACTAAQFVWSVLSLPRYTTRIVRDPLSVVDIQVTSSEITFREFRIRDAELLVHGIDAARQKYAKIDPSTKQAIADWGWDVFVNGVRRTFSNDDS